MAGTHTARSLASLLLLLMTAPGLVPHPAGPAALADEWSPITIADRWIAQVETGVIRHHPSTVLLPDGRVLVGGGNPDNAVFQERDNFRFYYPDSMTKPRPVIAWHPPTIALGSRFGLQWKGATPVTEVVLMALGSMTHSFDSSRRSIEREIIQRLPHGVLDVGSPASAEWASPGYYMRFVVDGNRVPSVGQIVKVE
jgi:hypothetical protein